MITPCVLCLGVYLHTQRACSPVVDFEGGSWPDGNVNIIQGPSVPPSFLLFFHPFFHIMSSTLLSLWTSPFLYVSISLSFLFCFTLHLHVSISLLVVVPFSPGLRIFFLVSFSFLSLCLSFCIPPSLSVWEQFDVCDSVSSSAGWDPRGEGRL